MTRALPLLALLLAAPAQAQSLVAQPVAADLARPDPAAAYWQGAPELSVMLMAQPMVVPRPAETHTQAVTVQAVHDAKRIAFRLRWKDPDLSEAGHLGEYSDAAALEFPIRTDPLPPVMMGVKGNPVHIFHWRAQYQRDAERGKPSVHDLYPNCSVDMYPLEFPDMGHLKATEAERECYSPGRAEGNPQSYAKSGVDEIYAEGFSTSSVQEGHQSAARGVWAKGEWTLVISRALASEGGSTVQVGQPGYVGFAVWQGGEGEVGSRKCVTMTWTPLEVRK